MPEGKFASVYQCSAKTVNLRWGASHEATRDIRAIHEPPIHQLQPEATHKEFLSVRHEGSRDVPRRDSFYNLDAIISFGYRVKSRVATQFRIWATQRLRDAWRAGRSFSCQLLDDNWGRRRPAPSKGR
jgi:hypothetical protein